MKGGICILRCRISLFMFSSPEVAHDFFIYDFHNALNAMSEAIQIHVHMEWSFLSVKCVLDTCTYYKCHRCPYACPMIASVQYVLFA